MMPSLTFMRIWRVGRRELYGKVESDLGALVLDGAEEACLLVGAQLVGESSGCYQGGDAS